MLRSGSEDTIPSFFKTANGRPKKDARLPRCAVMTGASCNDTSTETRATFEGDDDGFWNDPKILESSFSDSDDRLFLLLRERATVPPSGVMRVSDRLRLRLKLFGKLPDSSFPSEIDLLLLT